MHLNRISSTWTRNQLSHVPTSDSEPWYDCIAVGKNTLATMVKRMCQDAGSQEKSKHSLRATSTALTGFVHQCS